MLASALLPGANWLAADKLLAYFAPDQGSLDRVPNYMLNMRGVEEMLDQTYGMWRHTGVNRGHLKAFHSGSLGGFYSQVSYLPNERVGVVVFVIGHHCALLSDCLTWHLYERLMDLDHTP